MNRSSSLSLKMAQPFKLLCVVAIVIGLFFRITNLDNKFYWGDEVRTSMRVSGYTEEQVLETSYTGEVLSFARVRQYHFPQGDRTVSDTVSALAHHPEHPPLFYFLLRFWVPFWMQWFDNSVAVTRSLAMVFSVLTVPAVFFLCRELFQSPRVAWIATTLVAVSPLHILYAHEARQYSLWVLTTVLSSGMLLRSLRLQSLTNWGIYVVSLAAGLYSHLFFVFVCTAHFIYVFAQADFRKTSVIVKYLIANAIAGLAFSPWIWIIFSKTGRTSEAIEEAERNVDFSFLLFRWFRNLNRTFFNADLGDFNFILVGLVLYALYFLIKNTNSKIWLLILGLIGTNATVLMLTDILFGTVRSAGLRYLFIAYTGIQIAVAYLFAEKLKFPHVKSTQAWRVVLALFISVGIGAGVVNHINEVTWNKSDDKARFYIPAADILNTANNPRLISSADPVQVLTFSYRVKPETQFQFVRENTPIDLNLENWRDRTLFLFNPSETLKQQLNSLPNTRLELVRNRKDELKLWQVIRG